MYRYARSTRESEASRKKVRRCRELSNHQRATSRPVRGMGGGGAGRMGGVADMGALRPDAIDRPSTRLPNAPTRLLLLSSLASRLAALGWGIGARGVCAHAYGRAGRHVSAALYAPIDHPARSQHANSQAVLVSLLQSCFHFGADLSKDANLSAITDCFPSHHIRRCKCMYLRVGIPHMS